jgi:hypothetical protein
VEGGDAMIRITNTRFEGNGYWCRFCGKWHDPEIVDAGIKVPLTLMIVGQYACKSCYDRAKGDEETAEIQLTCRWQDQVRKEHS